MSDWWGWRRFLDSQSKPATMRPGTPAAGVKLTTRYKAEPCCKREDHESYWVVSSSGIVESVWPTMALAEVAAEGMNK